MADKAYISTIYTWHPSGIKQDRRSASATVEKYHEMKKILQGLHTITNCLTRL